MALTSHARYRLLWLLFSIRLSIYANPSLHLLCATQNKTCTRAISSISHLLKDHHIISGAFLVIKANHIIWEYTYGQRNVTLKQSVNLNTKFRVASISKLFTNLAFMQLVAKKPKLLQQTINSLLHTHYINPYYPKIAITPEMLMTHTSSLNDRYYDNVIAKTGTLNHTRLKQLLTKRKSFNPTKPGRRFSYSNLGIDVIGSLIEAITKQPFDQYTDDSIFKPLKMDASFNATHIKSYRNIATLYRWCPKQSQMSSCLHHTEGHITSYDNYRDKRPLTVKRNAPLGNALMYSPAGGLRISIHDLGKFLLMLLHNGQYHHTRILPQSTLDHMLQIYWYGQSPSNLYQQNGLDFQPTDYFIPHDRVWGHAAQAYGLIGDAYFQPDKHYAVAFILNGGDYGNLMKHGYYPIETQVAAQLAHTFNLPTGDNHFLITLHRKMLTVNQRNIRMPQPAIKNDQVPLISAIDALQLSAYHTTQNKITIYDRTGRKFVIDYQPSKPSLLNQTSPERAKHYITLKKYHIFISLTWLARYFHRHLYPLK